MYQRLTIWWQQYKGLLLLLLLLLLLRVPHFNRPLSKHHDFNNAVILINAVSWQQAGGGAAFAYTPVMNFQGESNKLLENGPHIDANGNHVYLSFGPGWYVLPYFIFTSLHITPSPAALEIISIVIGLLTVVLLYALLYQWLQHKPMVLITTAFFALMPGPLWYMGHSYVTTAIMLPLVLCFFYLWYKADQANANMNIGYQFCISVCIVALMYIDWIAAFLAAGFGIWAWSNRNRIASGHTLFFTAALSAATGILLIGWQFAQHVGWPQVMAYWQGRSAYRTIVNQDEGLLSLVKHALTHIGSGYATLLLLIAAICLKQRSLAWLKPGEGWQSWALASVALYNLVLFHWSASHEFAWMALALTVIIWLASSKTAYLLQGKGRLLGALTLLGVVFYYVLNLPGPVSISGKPYALPQQQANRIKAIVPAHARIFTHVQNQKIIEWYAGRTFQYAVDKTTAQRCVDSLHTMAYWLTFDGDQLLDIERMTAATVN